jgi:CspA family cold shock protein
MIKGTVKFFNGTKGFGFITPDDGSKEVFVPTATVTSSGAGPLKAGQRVSFEAEQEARGPKAVKLTLLDEPLREVAREPSRDTVREAPRPSLTLYYEADDEDAADVLAALAQAGQTVRQVDYVATPPSREELKKLSLMLREANQSLARRFEPLFMELQLDDRFISESEFLTGIFEHPTLINGPILASANKARVCHAPEDVQAFLGNGAADEKRPKGISARMAAMMLGHAVPEREVEKDVETPPAPVKVAMMETVDEKPAVTKIKLAPKASKTVAAAPAKKPVAKAPAKPVKAAKAVKAKAPAKPVKKAKR